MSVEGSHYLSVFLCGLKTINEGICDKYFYSVDINREKTNKQGGTHQVFTLN